MTEFMTRDLAQSIEETLRTNLNYPVSFRYVQTDPINEQYDKLDIVSKITGDIKTQPAFTLVVTLGEVKSRFVGIPINGFDPDELQVTWELNGKLLNDYSYILHVLEEFEFTL